MYNRREPRLFKPDVPLVMARQAALYEHEMMPGDVLTIVAERGEGAAPGEVPLAMAIRLWVSNLANYANCATPVPEIVEAADEPEIVDPKPAKPTQDEIDAAEAEEKAKADMRAEAERIAAEGHAADAAAIKKAKAEAAAAAKKAKV